MALPDENLLNQPIKIIITIPTQAYFLSGIRDFTLNLIKNMTDFSEKWAFRFQSIVDELCNNAIEYGSTPGNNIVISFYSIPKESIQIEVEDTGTGTTHLKAADLSKIVEERRNDPHINRSIRGRGLPKIVAEWTDTLEFTDIETGGIKVRVKKLLNDPKFKSNRSDTLAKTEPIVLN